MTESRLQYGPCLDLLARRISERAPARIQLLAGPRQVGKTTLLLALERKSGEGAVYAACDAPEASLTGFWERLWARAEELAERRGRAVLLLDEIQQIPDWPARLKGQWDRLRRRRTPLSVVASGSSALRLGHGSRETLAGRFERLELIHWSARSLETTFGLGAAEAAELVVRRGAYPGAMGLLADEGRWAAYVRDAIVDPAVGRDALALAQVRRPALLRQIFAVAASAPCQIISLQKLQGRLQDRGALETIAHYLGLLEQAYVLVAVEKHAGTTARRRAAPPKLVPLSNAFLAVADPRGIPEPGTDPARFGAWVENASLAYAWCAGQSLSYWREEPLEVDAVLEGSWGRWAIEVKTSSFGPADLRGLAEFTRRNPSFRPLVLCERSDLRTAERAGLAAQEWREFLVSGPPAPG